MTTRSYRSVLALEAVIYVLLAAPTLTQWSGRHQFWRQAQTADTARIFQQFGIDLFHPRLSVFGPNTFVAFELPWYQALGSIGQMGLFSTVVSLRMVSIVSTVITALGVANIAKRFGGERAGAWAAGLYLLNPFTMLWGRVSLMETFTTAAVLWWIIFSWKTVSALDPGFPKALRGRIDVVGFGSLAIGVGSIASTSKMTTFVPWVAVLVAMLRPTRIRRFLACGVLTGVPLVAGVAWTRWADNLKTRSVFSSNLTSDRIHHDVFRGLEDRLDLVMWVRIGARLPLFMGGLGLVLVAMGVVYLKRRSALSLGLSLLSVPIVAPSLFFGVYAVHDYYLSAVTPAAFVLMGTGAAVLVKALQSQRVLLALLAVVHLLGFWVVSGDQYGKPVETPSVAVSELRSTTWITEQVVGAAFGYDPYPYFRAERRGTLISDMTLLEEMRTRLDTELGSPRVLWSEQQLDWRVPLFLDGFRHLASVGTHTYRFGNTHDDLWSGPTNPVVAWESAVATGGSSAATGVRPETRVTCDGTKVRVDGVGNGFWIETSKTVWLGTNLDAALLPVGSGVISAEAPVTHLRCMPTNPDGTASGSPDVVVSITPLPGVGRHSANVRG